MTKLLVIFVIVNCTIYFHVGLAFASSSSSEQKIGFNFDVVGDMGCSPMTEKIINDINNKDPEVVLALGDLSYQRDNADCWLNIVAPIETTEIPFDTNSSQYNFIKNDLEAASKNPDINWIIVYSYRPQYSSPSEHPGNSNLRDLYHPLFQKYNVDIVLQAHDHNYQRSYPISYNKGSSSNPLVTDNDIKSYQDPAGQVYVTVGTGGSALHDLNGKARYVSVQYKAFGFLDISITSRNLTGSFYDSSHGTVKDQFTLIK